MKFQVIYIDIPWWYNARNNTNTKFCGGASGHYPLMQDSEVLRMKSYINTIADKNCIMFMWVTPPRLNFALDVLKYWQFNYKTKAFTWIKIDKQGKPRANCGFYTASNSEDCIIAVRQKTSGFFKPDKKLINQIILEPLREHSRKPDIVIKNIELMYPKYNKIEVFARQSHSGWTCVGNEINGVDLRNA
jgi:N6-adenosine-specific RNA methylase IME4